MSLLTTVILSIAETEIFFSRSSLIITSFLESFTCCFDCSHDDPIFSLPLFYGRGLPLFFVKLNSAHSQLSKINISPFKEYFKNTLRFIIIMERSIFMRFGVKYSNNEIIALIRMHYQSVRILNFLSFSFD